MPSGGGKKSLRTSSIVQIVFSFWSLEISEDILRNQKFIVGLDSFSNQRLIFLASLENISFLSTIQLKVLKLLQFYVAPCCQS